MDDRSITHKSKSSKVSSNTFNILETTDKNGVKCEWSGKLFSHEYTEHKEYSFSWSFDWNELKKFGFDGLSGHIKLTEFREAFTPRKIDVDITANHQIIETSIEIASSVFYQVFMFEYQLLPYFNSIREEVWYNQMFLPSELNDTVLVIDEKRLHVNKAFLSYHSEFFRTLFSSKFKEGQMDEIPIEDVSYEDFGLLMSTIYPNTVFPNDKTVEKLLELADRFLVPSVIRHVEFYLLRNTRINSEKLIWMAGEYGMAKLLKKCLGKLNTIEKVKKLHTNPHYEKLSKDAKAEILDILMKMI